MMMQVLVVTVAFLILVVVLDHWRAAVKTADEYRDVCWACGQRTQHHWGCPNR
jgi:hypothetical protein